MGTEAAVVGTEQADVFTVADIATLGHTVQKRWVRVPEWGNKQLCMWGTTGLETRKINDECGIALKDPTQFALRRRTATILYCARDGDGPDAKPVFGHDQWGWLEAQPNSALDTLYNAVQELDISSGIKADQIIDFFAVVGSLRTCLAHIGSACGACTDCPENSRMSCPQQLLDSLFSPTE